MSSNSACNHTGDRTEWSPIWSVIIRVITKSDDRAAGVRFVYHEYNYRPNWTTRSPITITYTVQPGHRNTLALSSLARVSRSMVCANQR